MDIPNKVEIRLNLAKQYREEAKQFFVAPFMGHLLECCKQSEEYKNNPMDEQQSKEWAHSLGVFYYHKYVQNNMMFGKTIHRFVNILLIEREAAQSVLGFDEEFDWVGHCYKAAQIHEHSKEFALLDRKFLFENQDIHEIVIKFYEDVLDSNPNRITKILSKSNLK